MLFDLVLMGQLMDRTYPRSLGPSDAAVMFHPQAPWIHIVLHVDLNVM